MKFAPLISLLAVLLSVCGQCWAQGEIGPHLKGAKVRYLGAFYDNYVYLRAFSSGEFTDKSKDGTFIVNTWSVSETFCNLYKDTVTGRFAIYESHGKGDEDVDLRTLEFVAAPKESQVFRAWDIAEGAVPHTQKKKDGVRRSWVNVEGGPNNGGLRELLVSVGVKSVPGTKILKAQLLIVETGIHMISVDPRNRTFGSRKMDLMGTPLGEEEFHKFTPGSVGEALLKLNP
jgi:hypothetical protein